MVNAQEWLDENYPKELRKEIKNLELQKKNLEGELDLSDFVNLEELDCCENKLTGSLKSLKNLVKLKKLDISDTDIDSGLKYLPESIRWFRCSASEKKDAKCQAIYNLFANEKGEVKKKTWFGRGEYIKNFSQKLQSFKNWTSGNQEVDEFIKKYQSSIANYNNNYKGTLQWIPYEQFTNIEYLAEGGFGKVYKAYWDYKDNWFNKGVVLKSLNNSVNIKTDFLKEIANHKLLSSNRVVNCFGISQDPETKNYLMVMEHIKDGDLRKFLQNNQLDFKSKLAQLWRIVDGLKDVHKQNLTHCDFHSGNILNKSDKIKGINDVKCYIADLGLCCPANIEDKTEVYGQIPYVAPEILGKEKNEPTSYTQASDIYSFGIVAYELFAVSPPYGYSYSNVSHQTSAESLLIAEIISRENPKRPNLDIVPLPQLLKALIKQCWDADPKTRPIANDLVKILNNWRKELNENQDTEFTQQAQEIEDEYNKEFQNKQYPKVNLFSKVIPSIKMSNEAGINSEQQNFQETNYESDDSSINNDDSGTSYFEKNLTSESNRNATDDFDLDIDIKLEKNNSIEKLTNRTKRQLSLETQTKNNQGETKLSKINEEYNFLQEQTTSSEPMEMDENNSTSQTDKIQNRNQTIEQQTQIIHNPPKNN